MPSCAFLTIADMGDYVSDDELAASVLRDRGWRVAFLPWDEAADWSLFDLVVIRTTWDYQDRPAQFQDVLAQIERSPAALHNALPLVRWNLDKGYLEELAQKGVPIVPTRFGGALDGREALQAHFRDLATEEIILKPLISASAYDTFHLSRAQLEAFLPRLTAVFGARPYLAQPFMPQIKREGEFSLIYLNGAYSHTVLKTPQEGDFRVQEEYGGRITAVTPERALLRAGQRAMDALDEPPLYARVDLVRHAADDFRIMEFELIEPSLYLRMDAGAPARFADALTAVLGR